MEDINMDDANASAQESTTPARRQSSLLKKNSRRSTILSRSANQSEPIIENPNNPPDINEQLKGEYETVQTMNMVLGKALKHFEEASERIHQFSETINRTDQLLNLWLSVLEKTEEIRSYVEDSSITASEERRTLGPSNTEELGRRVVGSTAALDRAKEVGKLKYPLRMGSAIKHQPYTVRRFI